MPAARSIWAGASALNPIYVYITHVFTTAIHILLTATPSQQGTSQAGLA